MISIRAPRSRFMRSALAVLPAVLVGTLLTGCGKKGDGRGWWEVWKDDKSKTSGTLDGNNDVILPPPMMGGSGQDFPMGTPLGTGEEGLPMTPPPNVSLEQIQGTGLQTTTPSRQGPGDIIPSAGLEMVRFITDSYVLSDEAMRQLDANAQWIINNLTTKPGMMVQLAGHCDSRGSLEYNMALGENRALTAREYLFSKGVPYDKMMTISYGEERPRSQGNSETAWKDNRRVEFIVYQ